MSAIFGPNDCNISGISWKKAIQYYYYYLFPDKNWEKQMKNTKKKNSLSFLISILRKDCCMPKAFITSQ